VDAVEVTRLPGYFPTYGPKHCRETTAKFFHCFSQKGAQKLPGDYEAARRGLQQCQPEVKAWMRCVEGGK